MRPTPTRIRHPHSGFTLIELLIAVAIIGILSVVALPSFMSYIRKARSSEARTQLKLISDGARLYYLDEHFSDDLRTTLPKSFPMTQTSPTPIATCCANGSRKCMPADGGWENDETWRALGFAMSDPHYYRYQFVASGTGLDAEFTGRAFGDLDCDGIQSTFEIHGTVSDDSNDVRSGRAIGRQNELE